MPQPSTVPDLLPLSLFQLAANSCRKVMARGIYFICLLGKRRGHCSRQKGVGSVCMCVHVCVCLWTLNVWESVFV